MVAQRVIQAPHFEHKNYRWFNDELEDLPVFDFNNQADIHKLNAWPHENLQRITGIVNRPRGTSWLEVEDDFVDELHREL